MPAPIFHHQFCLQAVWEREFPLPVQATPVLTADEELLLIGERTALPNQHKPGDRQAQSANSLVSDLLRTYVRAKQEQQAGIM